MHTFTVAKAEHGWVIKVADAVIAPARSQLAAVEQAERMADALRANGEVVAIVIERDPDPIRLAVPPRAASLHVWASRRELRAR